MEAKIEKMKEMFNKDLEELKKKYLEELKKKNRDEEYNNWNEKYTRKNQ